MRITGILVPADIAQPMQTVEFEQGEIEAMQRYVGGHLELIEINRPDSTLWFDSEGKSSDGWQINWRATFLLWVHRTRMRGYDVIAGDALITGTADDHGRTTSAPKELLTLLFETNRFIVQVQDKDGSWHGNDAAYARWEEAYEHAIRGGGQWTTLVNVRVIPA